MKSISRAVSAPHCVCALRDRHRLHTLRQRKIAVELNSGREKRKIPPRNRLPKLNIKNAEIIVCGKAICLQLGDSHIRQGAERENRMLMEWQGPLRCFKIQPRPTLKKTRRINKQVGVNKNRRNLSPATPFASEPY